MCVRSQCSHERRGGEGVCSPCSHERRGGDHRTDSTVPVFVLSLIPLLPVHRSCEVMHPGVSVHRSTGGLSPHSTAGGRPGRPLSVLCPFLRPHPHGCEHI